MLRVLYLLLITSTVILAQSATATIFGTVTDSSGAALPKVQITATLLATGAKESVTANERGDYIFPALRPGTYTLDTQANGFRRAQVKDVLIEVNQRARLDFSMQVGEVKEVLEVSSTATTVDTFSGTIKEVVDSGRMVELPLNGRNALQLQALLPGAIQMGIGSAASGIALNTNIVFSVNGARPNNSAYTLDGGLNMDMYNNLPAAFPNPDTLQEFSILQNGYNAVNGRNAGAVINMVTKSGTNEFRGVLFNFLRNDKLNTRNFFASRIDPLRRNQFGGTFGGPIIKDKTFFFVAYEGTRQRLGATSSSIIVPTQLERTGDFSQSSIRGTRVSVAPPETVTAQNPQGTPFPNSVIPASRLDPVARKFADVFMPLPNRPGNIFAYNVSLPTEEDQITIKFDHNFSDKQRTNFRMFFDDFRRNQNAGLLAFNSQNNWVTYNATLNHATVFSPSLVNSATLTVARNTFVRAPLATEGALDWAALGCRSCISLSPAGVPTDWAINISNGLGVRVDTNFNSYMMNYQFIDNLTWTRGNHTLTFGGEISKVRRNGREFFQKDTQFTVNGQRSGNQGYGYADFFLGAANDVYQNSPIRAYQYKWTPFFYLQDDWRVTRRLTLNLGLRYEPFLMVQEKNQELGAFRPGQRSTIYPLAPVGALFPGDNGIPNGIVGNDWNKPAPRFGFAWDPFGNGKTSVRGGYGIFWDTLRLVGLNTNSINQPFSFGLRTFTVQLSDPYANNPGQLQTLRNYTPPITAEDRARRAFVTPITHNSVDPGFSSGYMQQWNLNVQRELFFNTVFTVAYIGSKGTGFMVGQNINPAVFTAGQSTTGNVDARRLFQGFSEIRSTQSTANSTYHSLQLSWNRRLSGGFSILGSYVWAKSLDLASNDGNSGTGNQATNPFRQNLDKGPSDFDVQHRVVNSVLWDLPFGKSATGIAKVLLHGWQLNGISTMQTGLPFSVSAGVDRSLAGIGRDRGDILRRPDIYGGRARGEMIQRYFDVTALALPALGTFGTSSRNLLNGPGLINFDLGAFKAFAFSERRRLEFRWEVFNALNKPNFLNPVSAVNNPNFGRITSARDSRIMQAALKLYF
ncbi:MAG: TonB-dependent receptor [Acidobacteria bacterium]|nr:TonB-dependent receptor [Acidobacteriota bacterium]